MARCQRSIADIRTWAFVKIKQIVLEYLVLRLNVVCLDGDCGPGLELHFELPAGRQPLNHRRGDPVVPEAVNPGDPGNDSSISTDQARALH